MSRAWRRGSRRWGFDDDDDDNHRICEAKEVGSGEAVVGAAVCI